MGETTKCPNCGHDLSKASAAAPVQTFDCSTCGTKSQWPVGTTPRCPVCTGEQPPPGVVHVKAGDAGRGAEKVRRPS
jgi:hypothetical protein